LNLQERMNRLLQESLGGPLDDVPSPSGHWVPLADVYETADRFLVQVELPGLEPDDFEVQLQGTTLTVRGERRMQASARPDSFHRMERSYGSFARSFTLSDEVDAERLSANYGDGLLSIEIPKRRRSSRRGGDGA
jgi:HSP20 family protein